MRAMTEPPKRLVAGWNRFWFEPVSTSTLGVIRIGFGLVTLLWTLTLVPDLRAFYTPSGILPAQPSVLWGWGLLEHSSSMTLVLGVFTMLLIGSVGVLLGYWSRLSTLLVFIGLMSFQRRDPWVLNTGDWLLRILAFYLLLAPVGAALSLDRYSRDREHFWESPLRSPWVVRLIQLQLSAVYLFSVWAKVQGTTWNDGSAVSYALRIGDFARVHLPHAIAASPMLTSLMTYGALATELSMAFLVWNRKARPYVIAAGVVMHLLIDSTLLVGFFSYEIFIAYLAWIPPERLDALLARMRARFSGPTAKTEDLAAVSAPAPPEPRVALVNRKQETLPSI
jgi:hypothetical protein